MAESLARERISALVSTRFAVGALLLAALGLYGLLAYLVATRTKDIGIRIAFGARLSRITGSVVAGGLALVAIGIAGSLLLVRSVGTLLFGVPPYDVPTYAIVIVLLGAIAALASARRAAHRAAHGAPTGVDQAVAGSTLLQSNGTQDSSCSKGLHGPDRQAPDGRHGPLLLFRSDGQRNRRLASFSFRFLNAPTGKCGRCARNCAQSAVPKTRRAPTLQPTYVVALSGKGGGLH